jgi:hypothetical protein
VHLVPIPTTPEFINATYHLWSPFLPHIARRSVYSLDELLGQLHRVEVQPVLVYDGANPVALLGVSYTRDGEDLVAELVWLTGANRHRWQHLLPELERFLRDMQCVKCRPICRPGWKKFLELHGYQHVRTDADHHIAMEKVLT